MWHSGTALSEGSALETATTPAPSPALAGSSETNPPLVHRPPAPRQIDRRVALFFGFGWPLVVLVNMAVEPESTETASIGMAIGVALFLAFAATMIATVMAAARRSPVTPLRSTWAGVLAVAVTIGCPLSGHHAGIGAWWFTQMALSVAMLAVSAAFLRRSPAPSAAA